MDIFKQLKPEINQLISNIPLAFANFQIEYNSDKKPIDLIFRDVNDVYEQLSGKCRNDLVGNRLSEAIPEIKNLISEQLILNAQNFKTLEYFQNKIYFEYNQRWYDVHVKAIDHENVTLLFNDITTHIIHENQINGLNHLFLEMGLDPTQNIHTVVKKTNDIIPCACSLYNRIDDETRSLITWSDYNAPADLDRIDKPDGHICFEATIKGVDKPVIIEDITGTEFFYSDPNVMKYGLRSYLGMPVIVDGKTIGSLCVVDTIPKKFSNTEVNIIGTLAKVLSLEQKRYFMEENLKKAVEESKKANEAKNQFLANMSHEIRTPLNGIIGFSEMLSSQEKDERKARILNMIEDSGNQLVQIVNDIFDYSRIESGKIRLHPVDFRLDETINETTGYFKDAALKKNIKVDINIDGITENDLFGDLNKFKQILINVLSNAIKFTEEGSVWIVVKSEKSGNLARTEVLVEDTGIGIINDHLEMIFDDFKQLDHYLTKKIKGAGLGLAITKRLVEMMEGKIRVESEQGSGSRFIISIPFAIHLKNSINIAEVMNIPEGNIEIKFKKVKILLAEDNEANQFLIKAITKSQDWEITTVDNGEAAVEMFKANKYDLVLMDVQMPVMNGYDATKIIRDYEKTIGRRTPIIALTAYAMKSDKDLCIEAGMDDYISKPFKRQQFLDSILNVLKQNNRPD
jgi:signal transduction histidine kinase/ActR/RegA family two-component response regulator